MNDRDFLIFVSGYLKGIMNLKKIPSSLLYDLKNKISDREKIQNRINNSDFEKDEDEYFNRSDFHPNNDNYKKSANDDYDHDSDPDQQNPNFWT